MKNFKFLAFFIGLFFSSITVQGQVENLVVSSNIYQDTVKFVIENPTSPDVEISYIVIQDQVLFRESGNVIVPSFDSLVIKVQSDSLAFHDYTIEISESNGLRSSDAHVTFETKRLKGEAACHIQIYPNPANDRITLFLPKEYGPFFQVRLIDLQGRTVLDYREVSCGKFTFNRGSLSPGVYLLDVRNDLFRESQKIILQ